jgi:hypothetical protein
MRIEKQMLSLCNLLFLFFILLASKAYAEVITLHIPYITDSPKLSTYYHELLTTAIIEAGHTPKLIVRKVPHLRAKAELKSGLFSIFWMVRTQQTDKEFIPIDVGLTNRLISKRILFIKKGNQHLYDNVRTLEDFRNLNLVGGMGRGWSAVKTWELNRLNYKEQDGNWRTIFRKIPLGRDFDYFHRGVNEIIAEARQYPDLEIEKRLVLVWDRDFYFYLSKVGPNAGVKYEDILISVFRKAKESCLIDRFVRKYWGKDLETLNYDNRIKIYLKTPD